MKRKHNKKSPARAEAAMKGWLAYQAKVQRLDVINVALKMYDIPFYIRYVGPKKLKWAGGRYDKCYQYKFHWWNTGNHRDTDDMHFDSEEEITAYAYAKIAEAADIIEAEATQELTE